MTEQEALVVLVAVDRGCTLFEATQVLCEELTEREPLPDGQVYDWHARSGRFLRFAVLRRPDGGVHGAHASQRTGRKAGGVSPLRSDTTIVSAIEQLRSKHERIIARWAHDYKETLFAATAEYVKHTIAQHQPPIGCVWSWDRVAGEVIAVVPGPDDDVDDLGLEGEEIAQLQDLQRHVWAELGIQATPQERKRLKRLTDSRGRPL